jgi:hypothetical protein
MAMSSREVEITADQIDCDLYRVICRVENLYDSLKRETSPQITDLHKSLQGLRHARSGIRNLMSVSDQKRTPF